MVGVTTVALIERRPDVSRDLFSRYWRDVHGVMAARIPGFLTYTQYHVTPLSKGALPFEGIALVSYANEADREGLVSSEVTQHIHRDEQNVFRRALLYNLDERGVAADGDGDRFGDHSGFLVLTEGDDADSAGKAIAASGATFCDAYDLRFGDPAGWNDTDVSGQRCTAVLHAGWANKDLASSGLAGLASEFAAYSVDEVHVMVEAGMPTAVGLRGLDAVRTIKEANGHNQFLPEVVRAIYGPGMALLPDRMEAGS